MFTATEVDTGQQGTGPGNSSFARIEVDDIRIEKDSECVADAVDDEVANERRQDDYPAPASIRRHRNVVNLHVEITISNELVSFSSAGARLDVVLLHPLCLTFQRDQLSWCMRCSFRFSF